jgi:hypothetical protein
VARDAVAELQAAEIGAAGADDGDGAAIAVGRDRLYSDGAEFQRQLKAGLGGARLAVVADVAAIIAAARARRAVIGAINPEQADQAEAAQRGLSPSLATTRGKATSLASIC